MLKTLFIVSVLAQSTPTDLSSGSDLQAWRSLGPEASIAEISQFLNEFGESPLAELAVRRLEAKGGSLPTSQFYDVLQSVLNHDAQLVQLYTSVAITPVTMVPLTPAEIPRTSSANTSVADAN
jgi:hypothetical protein